MANGVPRAPVATRRSIRPEGPGPPDADHRFQARFTRERALPCRPRGDQRLNQAIFGRGLIRMPMRIASIVLAAATAAVVFSGDVLGARQPAATTEVVVTLKSPSLASFGRTLQSAGHSAYRVRMRSAQDALAERVQSALPAAKIRWRYSIVANGFAVVVPRSQLGALAAVPGVDRVWPNVRYHALRTVGGPEQIGADKLWGPNLATAGNGMKIGIIDDGLQATHPYFNPAGYAYPPGFPKGQTQYTTPKVIVQRTFAPASPSYANANLPFDPKQSFHATHVAGIAAGDHNTNAGGTTISGVAPNAYLGNYKALTIPTPDFGLDGNSAEIAAAIDAAVSDGMDVINLSLGEPEIEPTRDIVVSAINRAAAAGVVPVIAAGNDFGEFGAGSVSSPGNASGAITVAAVSSNGVVADFSSAGPTPVSLAMKPDVAAPGVQVLSSLPGSFGLLSGTSMAAPHIAGAAALLAERHPTWTVPQLKAALTETGDPVRSPTGGEVLSTREGGGLANLVRADNPLLFAQPTGLSFGRLAAHASATQAVALTDAGGGAGDWAASVVPQSGSGSVAVPATVTVPGSLSVTATAGAVPSDVTGFIVLTRGTDVAPHPVLLLRLGPEARGRDAHVAAAARQLSRDDERRACARQRLPLSDGRRRHVPRTGTRLPRHDHRPPRELRRRRHGGPRRPPRHVRRPRGSPRRLHGSTDRPQPVPADLRRARPDRRGRPAGRGCLRPRLRHAFEQ